MFPQVDVSKYVNIVNHTSHPHVMADGTVYNVGISVTPLGPRYNVVCFYPNRATVGKTPFVIDSSFIGHECSINCDKSNN